MHRNQAVVAIIAPLRCARNVGAPILRLKPADPAEFPLVRCDEDESPGQRAAGNQRVVCADGASLLLKRSAQRGRCARVLAAVREDRDSLQQGMHHRSETTGAHGIERGSLREWPDAVREFDGIRGTPRFESARRGLRAPRKDPLA